MSDNCLFCKIAKGEIPSNKVFEDESVLGFVDLHPQAKLHYLFIHKNHTKNINELASNEKNLGQIFTAIKTFTEKENLDQEGFRIVTNSGKNGGQTVFHTHFHLLGGEKLSTFGS
jgi:histidine triad (HIT) family protein